MRSTRMLLGSSTSMTLADRPPITEPAQPTDASTTATGLR